MTIKTVLFDAAGTLLRPQPNVAAAYAAASRSHGLLLDESVVAERFHRAFQQSEQADRALHRYRTNQEREVARWRQIVAEVFPEITDSSTIFAELWDHFSRFENWRLFDDAAEAWQQLSTAGYVLGIASNFDQRLDSILNGIQPVAQCHHRFLSAQVGWRKPAREFYAHVEKQLGLSPAELMLVGDDFENDYLAARDAGWQAILLDRNHHHPTYPSMRSLSDLVEQIPLRA